MDDTFQPDDRRLKVLWIDDKPADIFPKRAELENRWRRIYVLTSRTTPEEVAADFVQIRRGCVDARHAPTYGLAPGPYDVILADFRMWEPQGGRPSDAARAPAAGLTIAVLAAFQCPEHPVAIIPYSAYTEEFGNQYALLKLGWPEVVHVVNDPLLHKAGQGGATAAPLLRASAEYREALLKSLQLGTCHVTMAEQRRWAGILVEAAATIPRTESLEVATPWGRRTFGIDALFADALSTAGVDTPTVQEWFAKLPVPTATERRARELADVYWSFACSRESWSRHYLARELASGRSFPELDVSQPPEITFDPIYAFKQRNDVDGYAPVRLAILFLMIRAIADDLENITAAQLVLEGIEHPDIKAAVAQYNATCEPESAKTLREALLELAEIADVARKKRATPLTEADVVRLVDPLPPNWKFALTLGHGSKIGKELETRCKPPLDVRGLLAGDGNRLLPSERASARRYAFEFIPTSADFPAWLQ